MKYVLPVITALLTGVVVFVLLQNTHEERNKKNDILRLQTAQISVQKRLKEYSEQITSQLQSFAHSVESDRNFQLRLLAENDRSSADVTEIAARFCAPMGFSVLEVTDSVYSILSSGHFPASAGNSISEKADHLTETPICFDDNIMGTSTLTLQAKTAFKIMDIPFYAMGGLKVDDKLLSALSPHKGVTVLLKRGSEYSGNLTIHSISDTRDNKILINDKEYFAADISLPYSGDGDAPKLIVVQEM